MSHFKNFLLFCSGVQPDVLVNCPTEETKYVGLGGTVLATSIFATLSAFVALEMAIPRISLLADAALAVGWGGFIFNFDRWFVSSYRYTPDKWWQIGLIIPRLAIALAFGTVIAVPVVLTVFKPVIERQMALNHAQAREAAQTRANVNPVYADIPALLASNQDLKTQIAERQALRDQRYREYLEEAEGVSGSGKVGKGPVFAEKGERLKEAQEELVAFKEETEHQIADQTKRIEKLRLRQGKELATLDRAEENATGILERMHALDQISQSDSVMAGAHMMLTVLFILMDTSPILLKLLMSLQKKTPYDDQMEAHETKAGTVARRIKEEAEVECVTELASFTVYNESLQEAQKTNAQVQAQAVADAQHKAQMQLISLFEDDLLKKVSQNPHHYYSTGVPSVSKTATTPAAQHPHVAPTGHGAHANMPPLGMAGTP